MGVIVEHLLQEKSAVQRIITKNTYGNISDYSVPEPENEVYLAVFRAVSFRFCGQNDTKRIG